ncbi:hypothetical protein BP6252_00183 [Coleophoma cylindrospora]|uniref:Uncharacterized protein n=1 Tax=Coleophoma cylindrospora TaxID=1849047 RepID=A0A3D8SPP8_9HELO|nr:hypothetical protein BP6252_00183 [Coleophoma cylindrospora]
MDFEGVRIAGKPDQSRWNIYCENGLVTTLTEHESTNASQADPRLLCPSLCHPHIHLDKCFLLSHPKYADLEIQKGDFQEALSLTNEAKSRFTHEDLMERGRALIEESIGFGVTHMRAFVEVDAVVQLKCLDAGLALKEEFKQRCYVQICVFAQDPIFSYGDEGTQMKDLLRQAVGRPGVEAFGSTPYVEKTKENQSRNIQWTLELALERQLHVDFHMDYNLDPKTDVYTLLALKAAKKLEWPIDQCSKQFRTIVFGHCTRLSLFTKAQWQSLRQEIADLPVSFVGLPTSDIFMMGRPDKEAGGSERVRGTLQVVQMIGEYGLNAAMGINNVGNAFTPQGSCDPLALACLGVGVYQAGTKAEAEILLQCVSTRAKSAIGLGSPDVELQAGQSADFVVFGNATGTESFRRRNSTKDLVYDAGHERVTVFRGKKVSQ